MKSLKFFVLATFFAVAMASCDNSTTEKTEEHNDSVTVENGSAATDTMNTKDDDDKDFVQDAVHSNEMEMKMLAEGQRMGTSKEIKDAAKKMAADHEKLGAKMKDYASKKNITLDQDSHDMDDKNDDKKGAEWDKDWIDDMVEMHEKDVKKFEDAQNDVADPELKTMISEALPILRSHLDMTKQIKAKMDK